MNWSFEILSLGKRLRVEKTKGVPTRVGRPERTWAVLICVRGLELQRCRIKMTSKYEEYDAVDNQGNLSS